MENPFDSYTRVIPITRLGAHNKKDRLHGFFIMCPQQEIIITILSDDSYMRELYEKVRYIREMGKVSSI